MALPRRHAFELSPTPPIPNEAAQLNPRSHVARTPALERGQSRTCTIALLYIDQERRTERRRK
ncbi:uncharacterized protein N7498_002945 [Penicillium cinerascens]|uniref:Uncharacterized protein n=1 Tax=Penicillium cinerascens TaxID=70096 RepID=A0A9W9NB10_9EURO|nr:uncharacterized protein N7498_002945 [Penicillium cinerascens]KAJ5216538.1 hypothetical protein N7498_002945 [Penicillium cinerascens]